MMDKNDAGREWRGRGGGTVVHASRRRLCVGEGRALWDGVRGGGSVW